MNDIREMFQAQGAYKTSAPRFNLPKPSGTVFTGSETYRVL